MTPRKRSACGSGASFWKIQDAGTPEERQEARDRPDLRIGALGSGLLDYGVFVDHLGVASLNLGYGGRTAEGFTIPFTMTSIGILILVIPPLFTPAPWPKPPGRQSCAWRTRTVALRLLQFPDTIHKYGDELKKLLKKKQEEFASGKRDRGGRVYGHFRPAKDLRASRP